MALMFNAWLSHAPWLHVGQVAILNTKPLCAEMHVHFLMLR